MVKTQIGLGVLSVLSVFDTSGIVPDIIYLIIVVIITTWSNYIMGVFKLRHRAVYSINDACGLMFGSIDCNVFEVAFCLYRYTLVCNDKGLLTSYKLDLCRRLRYT